MEDKIMINAEDHAKLNEIYSRSKKAWRDVWKLKSTFKKSRSYNKGNRTGQNKKIWKDRFNDLSRSYRWNDWKFKKFAGNS